MHPSYKDNKFISEMCIFLTKGKRKEESGNEKGTNSNRQTGKPFRNFWQENKNSS